MARAATILMVMTSHERLGDTGTQTGVWLEEMTTPFYAFTDIGAEVTLASIAGGRVPIDPRSLDASEAAPASVTRYQADRALQDAVRETVQLEAAMAENYDALFLAGGHGTMWDFPKSAALADAVARTLADQRFVVAICHGPAGLLKAADSDGAPVVKGRKVTGFSNAEERASGLEAIMPFALETQLVDRGGAYVCGPNFAPFAVRDGHLITGQNPASAEKVATLLIAAMRETNALEAAVT